MSHDVLRPISFRAPRAGGGPINNRAALTLRDPPRQIPNLGFGAANAVRFGSGPDTGSLPQTQVYRADLPIVAGKRKGVDNNVTGGGDIRRPRLDLAGNTPQQLAQMRATVLGTNDQPPNFYDQQPNMAQLQIGPNGGPLLSGFSSTPYDPYERNAGPLGNRGDPQGISWGGMGERPTVFDPARNFPTQFANTAGGGMFQGAPGAPSLQVGGPSPLLNHPFREAARNNVSKSNMTGTPAPRIKYTFVLDQVAQRFAQNQLQFWPLVMQVTLQTQPTRDQVAFQMIAAPSPPARIFDIVTANFLMSLEQKKPNTVSEVCVAADLLAKYRLRGVGTSDEGHRISDTVGEHNHALVGRHVVATQGGEALNVYNMWGALAYQRTVGFIFKGVPVEQIWNSNPRNAGSYGLDAGAPNKSRVINRAEIADVVLQYVPWMSDKFHDAPSHAELLYRDDFGVERQGIWVPFGVMMQTHGEIGDVEAIERSWCSKSAAVAAGQISIIVSRRSTAF